MKTPKKRKQAKKAYKITSKLFPAPPEFGARFFVGKKRPRVKVNFMMNVDLMKALNFLIGKGGMSNFVNDVLEESMIRFRREKASRAIDELRKKAKIRLTTEEIIRLKNYGRE